jgi:cell shape-determining protein MreD
MKRIAFLAVIVGGIADMVLTNVLGLPIAIGVIFWGGLTRLPATGITSAYLAYLHAHPLIYAAAMGVGVLASLLGGVIAALIAKHDRVLNGALSSWACLGVDAYSFATHTSTDGLLLQVLLTPVAPLAGALGGFLVARARGLGRPIQIVQM